jgi:hypothetical protein
LIFDLPKYHLHSSTFTFLSEKLLFKKIEGFLLPQNVITDTKIKKIKSHIIVKPIDSLRSESKKKMYYNHKHLKFNDEK